MNIYGVYKNARNSSWQCIIDYKISALPVNLLRIVNEAGIIIRKNSEVHELSSNERGACILNGKTWYLVYDDESTIGRRRFTIAHELGHIFLGHELLNGRYGRSFNTNKPQSEMEADMFAARLLAPACVLWGLNIHAAEEISEICNISNTAAKIRAERMSVLYGRQRFLTSPLERKVYEQFKGFISKSKKNHF